MNEIRCRGCGTILEPASTGGRWTDGHGFLVCVPAPLEGTGGGQAPAYVFHEPMPAGLDGGPASHCAYCGHAGDRALFEPFNTAGNLACRDNGACLGRQAAAELPRQLAAARELAASVLRGGEASPGDAARELALLAAGTDHLLWRMGIPGAQRHESMES
jgi:hypothetical protein